MTISKSMMKKRALIGSYHYVRISSRGYQDLDALGEAGKTQQIIRLNMYSHGRTVIVENAKIILLSRPEIDR